ncbi:hypothetical protein Tco_0076899 [Tanacetum coccineum]
MGNVKKSFAERTRHKRQYDRRMNERQMYSRESKVGTYITHAVDADIRPVNDQVPFAEVQLTAQHNVLANEQQHIEESEPIQDAEHDQVKSPLLKAEFLKTNDMVEKHYFYNLKNIVFHLNDGYCNRGNLPGTFIIENQLHYQDYEWYEALEDSELKDEALRNKAIMEGFI